MEKLYYTTKMIYIEDSISTIINYHQYEKETCKNNSTT